MSGRSALLVMDFQQGIVDRLGSDDVLTAATRAVDAARAGGVPVIYVRIAFRPGFPEISEANRTFAAMASSGADFGTDSPATALHPAFTPRAEEPVVFKRRVSAFTGSDLAVLLRGLGVDSLVLAGISTSGVVLSTLREAADQDYRLTVLSDACADGDDEVHRVLLTKVFPRQAEVCTVDDWASTV